MSARVTLSPNDSLWLNMDSPENLMVIEGVMWFDEPLEPEAVTRALRERMVEPYPVFTWRPQRSSVGLDHWVDAVGADGRQTIHILVGAESSQKTLDRLQAVLANAANARYCRSKANSPNTVLVRAPTIFPS